MDEHLVLETPEQVEVTFELAGLASRGTASLLDGFIQIILILLILIVLGLLGILDQHTLREGLESIRDNAEGSPAPSTFPMILVAIFGIVSFAVLWGYHVFFEMVTSGRSPGKQLLRLRVLLDSGTPVNLSASVIRNLVRVIDFLPVYYGVGLVSIMVGERSKRLGDLAAGTIVVRERPLPQSTEMATTKGARETQLLDPRVAELLRSFLRRRESMPAERRAAFARKVATSLQEQYGGAGLPPEDFLKQLYQAHVEGPTSEGTAGAPSFNLAAGGTPFEQAGRTVSSEQTKGLHPRQDLLRARRQERWTRLTELVQQLEKRGARSLSPEQIESLGRLYRASAADLARADLVQLSPGEKKELNALVARVHPHLYRGRPRRARHVLEFYLIEFPRIFRTSLQYTISATLAFALPFLMTYLAVKDDPTLTYSLLNQQMRANADAFEKAPEGGRDGGTGLAASSFYFTNNTSVAFRAFAGGVTAGLFTSYVLVANGVQLGATAALVEHLKSHDNFWAFVSPHGALELLAIFLAGGAGLKIGLAIIQPGDQKRREAMVIHGKTAVQMALGAAMLLFWAGLTEGFVSPSGLPNEVKYLIGIFNAMLLFLYLAFGDRAGRRLLRSAHGA